MTCRLVFYFFYHFVLFMESYMLWMLYSFVWSSHLVNYHTGCIRGKRMISWSRWTGANKNWATQKIIYRYCNMWCSLLCRHCTDEMLHLCVYHNRWPAVSSTVLWDKKNLSVLYVNQALWFALLWCLCSFPILSLAPFQGCLMFYIKVTYLLVQRSVNTYQMNRLNQVSSEDNQVLYFDFCCPFRRFGHSCLLIFVFPL